MTSSSDRRIPFELFLLDRGACTGCASAADAQDARVNDRDDHAIAPHDCVVVLGRHGDLTAIETVCLDDKHRFLLESSEAMGKAMSGDGPHMLPKDMTDFGNALLEFLLPRSLGRLYASLSTDALSLQILSDCEEITGIAWEYMAMSDPAPPPHPDRLVVRVHRSHSLRSQPPRPRTQPLRVLFATASPGKGQMPVPAEEALEYFTSTFTLNVSTGTGANPVELTILEECSYQALHRTLAISDFDIFHFLGHGDTVNGGRLLFQKANGPTPEPVDARSLGALLAGRGIRLAILSACWTSKSATPFGSVTNALLDAGMPAVVANQFEIDVNTIPPFIAGLYNSLLAFGDIDRAFATARSALQHAEAASGASTPIIWGVPTLHRLPDGRQLFTPSR